MIQFSKNPTATLTDADNLNRTQGQRMATVLAKNITGYNQFMNADDRHVQVLTVDKEGDVSWQHTSEEAALEALALAEAAQTDAERAIEDANGAIDTANAASEAAQEAAGQVTGKLNKTFSTQLTDTATEADIVAGNYFALDGSAGTKKLPAEYIAKRSVQDNIIVDLHSETQDFVFDGDVKNGIAISSAGIIGTNAGRAILMFKVLDGSDSITVSFSDSGLVSWSWYTGFPDTATASNFIRRDLTILTTQTVPTGAKYCILTFIIENTDPSNIKIPQAGQFPLAGNVLNKAFSTQLTNVATEADLVSGSYLAIDGSAGPKKLDSTTLLTKTAQNALAGNVAQAFDPTRDNTNPYKAGESVAYNGKTYTFKVDHYGAWTGADVYERDVKSFIDQLGIDLDEIKLGKATGKNLFNRYTKYKRTDCYVSYLNGKLMSQVGMNIYVVPVKEGDILSFSSAVNVAAFSVIPNLDSYSIGDTLIGFVSGISTAEQGWTVPATVVCLVVSVGVPSTYQIEKGSSSTSYEPYKEGVSVDNVIGLGGVLSEEESKTDAKLAKKLDYDVGKNLFNKNTTNKKANTYVGYNNGRPYTLADWSAYVVEIPTGITQVSISASGSHVCAFSSIPDLPTNTESPIPGYLGGVTGSDTQGWTLPVGTKCLVVSYADASIGTLQVESGATSTSYEPYTEGLKWNKIIDRPSDISKTLYVGSGQEYTTIQSAVDAASSGDTIFIFPGTYNEAVECRTTGKFLRLIGMSRDSVVLTHSGSNYYYPPLEIGEGIVENMTIKTTGSTIDPDSGINAGAYCVHIDYNQETNSSLQFLNCMFTSELAPCVGIGLRENFTLSFKNCEFVGTSGQAPVYCHEQQANNKTGQRIELIDCSLSNEGNHASDSCVLLQETPTLSGNVATILMQRCIMKRTYGDFTDSHKAVTLTFYGGSGTADGDGYLGSHLWKLDYMSELNSEAIANSSEQ